MKKTLIILFVMSCPVMASAIDMFDNDSTIAWQGDSTIASLSDIIAYDTSGIMAYGFSKDWVYWTTYINVIYNNSRLKSELPTSTGTYQGKFSNNFGIGLQWGHTYFLHDHSIGNMLFFGFDFTWLDLNFNKYKELEISSFMHDDIQENYMPWHHEKLTYDYGLSVGPSITLFPFNSSRSGDYGKGIRLHTYIHVGYCISGMSIKEVKDRTEHAFGHGLFYSFGASLSYDRIGLGYELRHDSNLKFKPFNEDYGTRFLKFKQQTSRFYVQLRF